MENSIKGKPFINVISSPDIPLFSQKAGEGMSIKYGNGEESIVYKVERYYEALNDFIRTGIQFENTSKALIKKIDPFLFDFLKQKHPEYANVYAQIYSDNQKMTQLNELIDVNYDFSKAMNIAKGEKKIFKYIEGFAKSADFPVSKVPSFFDKFFGRFTQNRNVKMLNAGERLQDLQKADIGDKIQKNETIDAKSKFLNDLKVDMTSYNNMQKENENMQEEKMATQTYGIKNVEEKDR